jgi:sporulation protein YlmC with PRC-barrel domain
MRSKFPFFAVLCFFALLGLSFSAMGQGDQKTIHKFGEVRSMAVKNSQGETLGDIEDVVVNIKSHEIVYLAMGHGEVLGFGGKMFAVAPTALNLAKDGKHFILEHPMKDFQEAKGFDQNNWPTEADSRWGKATAGKNNDNANRILRLSRVQGMHVRNTQGEDLGRMTDFALDLQNHRVAYAAVSYGTTLGLGGKLQAVPCQAFTLRSQKLDPARREFVLDISKQEFDKAPGFANDKWPTEPDARFLKK